MSGPKVALLAALSGMLVWGVLGAGPALTQSPQCSFHKVQASDANVGKIARANAIIIDVIERGEVVCVTRQAKDGATDFAFVDHKLADGERRSVQGWVDLKTLQPLTGAELQQPGTALSAAQSAPSAAPPPAAQRPAAPPPAAAKPPAASSETVLKFDEPVPFGAFPVNGRSIQELAQSTAPQFAPIEGLDEQLWKKPCSTCHRWDRPQLCEQGKSYAKNPRSALRQPHPFGGTYKVALMQWAKGGCQ
jgi:hypothetical protein